MTYDAPLPGAIQSVPEALAYWAARTPDAVALLSPGQELVTYRELHDATVGLGSTLTGLGLGGQDAIVIVFPEGIALCIALLAAMSVGVAVPLAWPAPGAETRHVLANRRVRAIVAAAEAAGAVRDAAGPTVPVITAEPGLSGRLGEIRWRGDAPLAPGPIEPAGFGDVAVILRSSGTSGWPKLVPRTHENIVSFCRNNIAARAFTPGDRGLSLARTVSSQGLHCVMTTIFAGASLIVVPGPDRRALPAWLSAYRPTYLATTPAVLRGIADERGALQRSELRCVFATSAPLGFVERGQLEATLGAPILNMYGLTEATGIAAERLPVMERVPGSVGPAWCDVQVISRSGEHLGTNEIGEIVVRGPRVTPGYLDNAAANAAAFLPDGWFRTGDLGLLDDAGFLHLRGRLGEIVNRGGDKIDPGEVDAVLLAHPAVADAATFSVPDPLLGEDIVAAVVLAANASLPARSVRSWMLDRLMAHKAPRRIWFVDELPRTTTGKVQRGVLRDRFLTGKDAMSGSVMSEERERSSL